MMVNSLVNSKTKGDKHLGDKVGDSKSQGVDTVGVDSKTTAQNITTHRTTQQKGTVSKRGAVLYIDEKIACRTCYNLNYTSQQQTKGTWQERDRMNKVREKLGWTLIKDVRFWERIKPKGMHYKTFFNYAKSMIFTREVVSMPLAKASIG